jgi:hypothetical protein
MMRFMPIAMLVMTLTLQRTTTTAFAQTADTQQTPTVGVCDVMQNLESYSGKIITVRGEVYFSREVSALGDRQCTFSFEAAGRKWPNAFWLAGSKPGNDTSVADHRQEEFLSAVLSSLMELYWRAAPITEPPYAVSAVFTGVLTTNKEYWASHVPAGFGHLGAYPAQLDVIAVKDVSVTPKPAK